MGHGDDGALVLLQMMLEPGNGFGVEMVRGLVEQQDVRLLEQQPAERHAALLAAGEELHARVARRAAQRVHGHLEPAVQLPGVQVVELLLHLALALDQLVHLVVGHGIGEALVDLVVLVQKVDRLLHALLHHLAHGLGRVELRLLLEEADGVARREDRLAHELLVHAGHDPEQRALARSVQAEHADLGAVEIGKIDVLQHRFLVVELAYSHHGVDDFVRFWPYLVGTSEQ